MNIEIDNIYNMDCLEGMKLIPDGSVDIVVTSPPYNFNLRVHYDRYCKNSPAERENIGGIGENKYGQTYTDDLTIEEYYEWQKSCIDEMLRVSKDLVFYNIQILSGNKPAVFRLIGHYAENIKEIIIWDKKSAEPAMHTNTLNSAFELIIVFAKRNCKARSFDVFNAGRGTVDNIFRIGKNTNKENTCHKACFPLILPRRIISIFSNLGGGVVLDPFMGSGTTAIACIMEKRHYIGFEINKEYFDWAVKRINTERSQLVIF